MTPKIAPNFRERFEGHLWGGFGDSVIRIVSDSRGIGVKRGLLTHPRQDATISRYV